MLQSFVRPPYSIAHRSRMLMGATRFYQSLVPGWMEPERLQDTTVDVLKMGAPASVDVKSLAEVADEELAHPDGSPRALRWVRPSLSRRGTTGMPRSLTFTISFTRPRFVRWRSQHDS